MPPSLKLVLVAAEAVPYAKSGGLGDVTSALAAELALSGLEVTVVLPAYGSIDRAAHGFRTAGEALALPFAGRYESFRLHEGRLPDSAVRVVLIDAPRYFEREGLYVEPRTGLEHPDAPERYAFFSRALVAALPRLGGPPDVLHLNDHHPALAAAYIRAGMDEPAGFLAQSSILFGIHNLGYQGLYEARFFPATGLPDAFMAPFGPLEFWGRMNYMKAGLILADVLVTVSPTYAHEIQHDEALGHGLQGVLRARRHELFGILNGIDTRVWDPARDALIPARYDAEHLEGKYACKRALQERCGLTVEAHTALFGMIGRLVDQKGLDLLLDALPALLELPLQLVVLGHGQPTYEKRLLEFASRHPGRVAVQVGFDDELAHWIEAGCDFYLMPSRYEPCGLNQMYSMRYGTVPVVRRTGGLADTVRDWEPERASGTGFAFASYAAAALVEAVRRGLASYRDPEQMGRLIRAGMSADFSWASSAREYMRVYGTAVAKRRGASLSGGAARSGAADARDPGH